MYKRQEFCKSRLEREKAVGEIDIEKVNNWGGSLSIGHPFGATGARLLTTAANRLIEGNGKYAMLSRPSDNGHTPFGDIYISYSPDMKYWGEHRCVMKATPFEDSAWQCAKIGAGPIPILTNDGWLMIYHGVINTCNGFRYAMGTAILDENKPDIVKYRTQPYLLGPAEQYEMVGDVPNVVFPCAALHDIEQDKLAIYYGAADTVVAMAFGHLSEVINFTKENSL